VERVRALARGEYGELQVGYSATPSWEILPDALATFRKALPRVKLILHDLFDDEIARLRDGTLELAVNAADNLQRIARVVGLVFRLLLKGDPASRFQRRPQILWINMVTSATLALAISFEPHERDVMSRPPRRPVCWGLRAPNRARLGERVGATAPRRNRILPFRDPFQSR
jgi:cation transport ATPase-like protein/LysR substrate binding domain-containing protein